MDLDGPSEIMGEYKDFFYTYEVSKESIDSDVKNFSKTLKNFGILIQKHDVKCQKKHVKLLISFDPKLSK